MAGRADSAAALLNSEHVFVNVSPVLQSVNSIAGFVLKCNPLDMIVKSSFSVPNLFPTTVIV